MDTYIIYIIGILLTVVIVLFIIFLNKTSNDLPFIKAKIIELQSNLTKIENNLKEDFRINREENASIAKDNRIELNYTLKNISEQSQFALREINKTLDEKVGALITKIEENNKVNREELTKNITDFSGANIIQLEKINTQSKDYNKLIREALVTTIKGFLKTFKSCNQCFPN